MPVLQNISTEYKIPILYLTFDSQTSDVGLMTRLEAFYDMIQMRKRNV
jgi:benzoyl-CoA reductase/2-hydroxyglutaryl-CoA dehydratase subunit BcrC/BadD/HgdB